MALNKTKKSIRNRTISPSHSQAEPKESFSLNESKKIINKKQNYEKPNAKLENVQESSKLKKNNQTQKYVLNESKMMRKDRKSIKKKSLLMLENQWSKISYSKIEEYKERKYRFNHSPDRSFKTPDLKWRQQSSSLSQDKRTGKKLLEERTNKNSASYVRNKFSVNESKKLRKKTINESKNLSKTYCQQMISTTIIHNNIEENGSQLNVSPFYYDVVESSNQISYKKSPQNQQQINKLQQIQFYTSENQNNLQKIRFHSESLFNSLTIKQRNKLSHITNGYEQILNSLAFVLSKKSPIQSNNVKNQEKIQEFTQKHNHCFHNRMKNKSSTETQAQTNPSTPQISSKGFKKVLNLEKLRHKMFINSIHDEFMDIKQQSHEPYQREIHKEQQF